MIDHKTHLSKCKKLEIIPSISSDHNSMKLKINNRRKTRKFRYMEIKQHDLEQPVGQKS